MSELIDDQYRRQQDATQALVKDQAQNIGQSDNKKKKTAKFGRRRKTMKIRQKINEKIHEFQWGKDNEKYNTIVETSFIVGYSFLTMQIFRMGSVIALFLMVIIYFYIYVRAALFHLEFYALLFTFLAFAYLFIGSGKQKVYQQLVDMGKINYDDKKKKSNLWLSGVSYYTLAVPLVLTSNFLYFVPMSKITSVLPQKYQVINQGFMEDINEGLEVYYAREQQNDVNGIDNHGINGWRQRFIFGVQIIPLGLLFADMLMNKIYIRWKQVFGSMTFIVIYFVITFLQQLQSGNSIYSDNLNWFGNSNRSYLVNKNSNNIPKGILHIPCNMWLKEPNNMKQADKFNCMPFTTTYWSPVPGQTNDKSLPLYSRWRNCFLFVCVTIFLNIVFFFINFGLHKVKLYFGGRAYNPGRKSTKIVDATPK